MSKAEERLSSAGLEEGSGVLEAKDWMSGVLLQRFYVTSGPGTVVWTVCKDLLRSQSPPTASQGVWLVCQYSRSPVGHVCVPVRRDESWALARLIDSPKVHDDTPAGINGLKGVGIVGRKLCGQSRRRL